MNKQMKAIAVLEKDRVELVEIPVPEYGPYECLVRTHACGFCSSTDMKIIHNAIADMPVQYPTILGHEGVGEIVAVGERVKNFKVGDRVSCSRGMHVKGTQYSFTWGEMSQYAIAHDVYAMTEDGIDLNTVTPGKTLTTYPVRIIPEGMSYPDAVMILTFEENYSALLNFGVQPGMDILIYGDGTIAQGLSFFARELGVRSVCCIGHHDDKLQRIREKSGVSMIVNSHKESVADKLGDLKFDMVIDAVGSMEVIREGFHNLKDNGKLCVYGVLKKEDANFNLLEMKNHTSLHLLTWPHDEHRVHDTIVQMIQEKKLIPSDYYTCVMPMDEIHEAIQLLQSRKASKIILNMDDPEDCGKNA